MNKELLIEHGKLIGEVTEIEIKQLVNSHLIELNHHGINTTKQEIFCNIFVTTIIRTCFNWIEDGYIFIRLIPELLRITANALDLMIQKANKNEER